MVCFGKFARVKILSRNTEKEEHMQIKSCLLLHLKSDAYYQLVQPYRPVNQSHRNQSINQSIEKLVHRRIRKLNKLLTMLLGGDGGRCGC